MLLLVPMPQRNGSSFGIISPDTNVVQTFDGSAPGVGGQGQAPPGQLQSGDYLPGDIAGLSLSELEDHYASEPLAILEEEESDTRGTATRNSPAAAPNEPLPVPAHGRLPRLARSVSMPVDAHLSHLHPPLRLLRPSPSSSSTSPLSQSAQAQHDAYAEISTELADSVQAIVQTLYHLSPPHMFDPVKELFSSCTVQLPTPSVSAMLTMMKNLNYLSANLQFLAQDNNTNGSSPSSTLR